MNRRNLIVAGIVMVVLLLGFNMRKKAPEASPPVENQAAQAKALYQKAVGLSEDNNLEEAREVYKKIIAEHPDFERIAESQKELESLNMRIIFSNSPSPRAVIHEVKPGDTLGELAKKYGTTINLIKRSNNLKNDIIRVGQRLRIWTAPFNLFVDKSQNILMLKQDDEVVKVYPVSTGENNSTPVGDFKITSKLVDPVWFNRGAVVPPESPQNVLGTRWLGFDIPGYGIHGTIEPEAIGQQVTAGCVRMRKEDVEELYDILPLGTKVTIVD